MVQKKVFGNICANTAATMSNSSPMSPPVDAELSSLPSVPDFTDDPPAAPVSKSTSLLFFSENVESPSSLLATAFGRERRLLAPSSEHSWGMNVLPVMVLLPEPIPDNFGDAGSWLEAAIDGCSEGGGDGGRGGTVGSATCAASSTAGRSRLEDTSPVSSSSAGAARGSVLSESAASEDSHSGTNSEPRTCCVSVPSASSLSRMISCLFCKLGTFVTRTAYSSDMTRHGRPDGSIVCTVLSVSTRCLRAGVRVAAKHAGRSSAD
mmetsp:Transcript_22102/g.55715  ORF Transcript_22102/g.55715 Transcript_22102/m.55715 type:complete len:264 (-) Transcript_22102:131-922(-)